jgi:hypothetical protein
MPWPLVDLLFGEPGHRLFPEAYTLGAMTLQVAQFLADLRTEQLVRPPLRQWIRNCEPDHLAPVYVGVYSKIISLDLPAEQSGAVMADVSP